MNGNDHRQTIIAQLDQTGPLGFPADGRHTGFTPTSKMWAGLCWGGRRRVWWKVVLVGALR